MHGLFEGAGAGRAGPLLSALALAGRNQPGYSVRGIWLRGTPLSEKIAQRSVGAAPPQSGSPQQQTFSVAEDEGAAAAQVGPAPRSLAPLLGVSRQQTLSIGIFPGPDDQFLLARAWQEAADAPRLEFKRLPRSLLQYAAGNLLPFFVQANQADALPAAPPWTQESRRASLQALLQEHDGELAPLLQLLAAALDERRLLLEGQARNTRSRIAAGAGADGAAAGQCASAAGLRQQRQ